MAWPQRTERLWEIGDIVEVLKAWEAAQVASGPFGPFRKGRDAPLESEIGAKADIWRSI